MGSSRRRSAGKGVLSRMDEMIVYGLRRVTSSSFWDCVVAGWEKEGRVDGMYVMSSWEVSGEKYFAETDW